MSIKPILHECLSSTLFRGKTLRKKYTQKNNYNDRQFSNHIENNIFFIGSVIRCMRRLEELLRQMCQAAKAIGNTELENKFAEGLFFITCVFYFDMQITMSQLTAPGCL